MITAEELRQRLDYDPETGAFTWKTGPRAGATAGCIDSYGYRQISLKGSGRLAHRLAWLHVYGTWPENQIDHINRDKSDNRIANLRDVVCRENLHNQTLGRSKLRGVSWKAKNRRWVAQIMVKRVLVYLGSYINPMDAHLHYQWARISYDREYF